jgi:predicted transcriptional regulator
MSIKEDLFNAADKLLDAEYEVVQRRRDRDDIIIRAAQAGITTREIGRVAGISHTAAHNIIIAERKKGE